jgi:dTMP kinase
MRDGGAGDRIGRRSGDYHAAVQAAFEHIARDEPDRVRLIDASGNEAEVTARLLDSITDLLP